jgi:hypothetical protein
VPADAGSGRLFPHGHGALLRGHRHHQRMVSQLATRDGSPAVSPDGFPPSRPLPPRWVLTSVWDGSAKTITLYKDGVQVATGNHPSINALSAATWTNCYIGRTIAPTALRLKAYVKDFRVYGTALR